MKYSKEQASLQYREIKVHLNLLKKYKKGLKSTTKKEKRRYILRKQASKWVFHMQKIRPLSQIDNVGNLNYKKKIC